jgi:hypothetical protein
MRAGTPASHSGVPVGALTRWQAVQICLSTAAVLLMGVGLCSAAILVPAPAAVVPLVAVSCAALPLLAGWRLPMAVAVLQDTSRRPPELSAAALRRELDRLPETDHPLGL